MRQALHNCAGQRNEHSVSRHGILMAAIAESLRHFADVMGPGASRGGMRRCVATPPAAEAREDRIEAI